MSDSPINKAEEFVHELCRRSVLSLWCYNNPRGKDAGKELCDILVVCDPHVIILSVKEVLLKDAADPVDRERWERKAVDASIRQIHGAERWLASATAVVRRDGSIGLPLPPPATRQVHRIAVAFGGKDVVPIGSGDSGKGFVHVMTERSFAEVLTELDTISDFVDYLAATEACAARGCAIVIEGSESNLLGWYLFNGRSFASDHNLIMVGEDIWEELQEKPEFRRRKEEDRESYYWDRFIELLSDRHAKPVDDADFRLTDVELVLRTMARETRFSRRLLGRGLREFFEQAKAGTLRSRILSSINETIYVLVHFGAEPDDGFRRAELGARCLIARHRVGKGDTVVGVGVTSVMPERGGSASDLVYLDVAQWSAEEDERTARMQEELGFFKTSKIHHVAEDEYPNSD